ncbi:MAG: tyrosine-type recombinase/integrase, partial [Acidimicrobiales bacterium]
HPRLLHDYSENLTRTRTGCSTQRGWPRTAVRGGNFGLDSAPKTEKGKRAVGLDPTTTSCLRAFRDAQREELSGLGKKWSKDDLVFVREDGEGYHPQRLRIMLAARARAVGLPPIKLHALRHGHATAALEAGVPMKVVSERLGHSGIAITSDVYSHVTAAADHAAAALVAATIDGAQSQ